MNNSAPAPAVPGGSAAPSTIDSSVNGTAEILSQIQAPIIPGQEIVSRAGQMNVLDPYLYQQFLSTAILTWNTSQLPGTVLYWTPLHPSRMNNIIQYLTKVYNTWAGGFQWKIKIAGTGFHAGALMMVRLPPNIHPDTITTVQQATAFEWEIFDPKTLELETRMLPDQRNILYHYNNDFSEQDRSSFGGYLVVMVNMQLATSSTGINSINVQLFNRLDPSFRVAQIIPPELSPVTYTPTELMAALNDNGQLAITGMKTSTITVSTVAQTTNTYNVVKADGFFLDTTASFARSIPESWTIYEPFARFNGSFGILPLSTIMQTISNLPIDSGANDTIKFGLTIEGKAVTSATNISPEQYDSATGQYDDQIVNTAGLGLDGVMYYFPTPYPKLRLGDLWSPPIRESVVEFSARTTTSGDQAGVKVVAELQPRALAKYFKNVRPDITQCILLLLQDKATGLPIRYFKLYPQGVLTTTYSGTILEFNVQAYEFVFVQYTLSTEPVPDVTPNLMTNMYMTGRLNGLKIGGKEV